MNYKKSKKEKQQKKKERKSPQLTWLNSMTLTPMILMIPLQLLSLKLKLIQRRLPKRSQDLRQKQKR